MGRNTTHLSCVIALNDTQDEDARAQIKKLAASLKAIRNVGPFIDIEFSDAPFTRENGLLRPNMKVDRRRVLAQYGA